MMMPRLVLCLSIFCTTGCVSEMFASGAGQDTADLLQRQLDLGIGYLRNQDYPRARSKLNRALETDPESALVHTTFGLLFQLEGEYDLAEQHFKMAIEYDGELTQARNNYGAFLYSRQRYQEAVEQFSVAAEDRFYVNRAVVFENLGVVYAALGDQTSAEDTFGRAIRLNPGQPRALLELAEIRFNKKNYVESRDLYNRHMRVASHSPRSLWLCIRVSRVFPNLDEGENCRLTLKNVYPASEEYRLYHESRHNKPHNDDQDD